MSKRLAAASLGFCLAAALTTHAEARVETSIRRDHDTGSITSRNLDRNSTIYSREDARGEAREDARPASRPRQTRTKTGRKHARVHKASQKPAAAAASQPVTETTAAARDGAATSAVSPDRAVTADHPGPADSTVAAVRDDPAAPRSCLAHEAKVLLARIEAMFGPVEMVSTCRRGAVIAGSGKPSQHRYGRAIDFDAGGRKGAIVNWLIAHHKTGGTMTYRGMSHIHVDIGPHFVSLGSGGRGGSRARKTRYARN